MDSFRNGEMKVEEKMKNVIKATSYNKYEGSPLQFQIGSFKIVYDNINMYLYPFETFRYVKIHEHDY